MKQTIYNKLLVLKERHEELSALLSEPEVVNDQSRFRELSREYAHLSEIVSCFTQYQDAQEALEDNESLAQDSDPEIRQMAQEEIQTAKTLLADLEHRLQILLLPQDPNDARNVFLEIRAGTGGDEAALFAGDLARMYQRYGESQHWQVEILSANLGEHGGYKEIIIKLSGQSVFSHLKFESGAHRVQRVPATESQGRVHTSACTVAVLPEVDEVDNIDINPSDLRVDTFRASGAGGQHVNKTDSAIRITHLPTGVVVECQDERSQHKNRARAMSLLSARLLAQEQQKQQQAMAATRKSLVGSGDRSERIRTYNFPQGRLTDHRINLTLYKLDEIMEGALSQVVGPLISEHQAELLTNLGDDES